MSDNFFVICNSDGDTSVTQLSKEELLKKLEEKYWGNIEFLEKINERDTNYWGKNILIIKGDIISPKPKTVITSYDV